MPLLIGWRQNTIFITSKSNRILKSAFFFVKHESCFRKLYQTKICNKAAGISLIYYISIFKKWENLRFGMFWILWLSPFHALHYWHQITIIMKSETIINEYHLVSWHCGFWGLPNHYKGLVPLLFLVLQCKNQLPDFKMSFKTDTFHNHQKRNLPSTPFNYRYERCCTYFAHKKDQHLSSTCFTLTYSF